MAFIGRDFDATALEAAFRGLAIGAEEGDGDSERKHACMSWLKDSSVFELCPVDEKGLDDPATCSVLRFQLTGTKLYGYSVAQMRTELRMDVDDMNRRLADAVNASIDVPKAFICYDTLREDGSVVLCHALAMSGEAGAGGVTSEQVAGNAVVLTREAEKILQNAFRNVASCACGQ